MRRALVSICGLLVFFLAVDFGLKLFAESWVADRLRQSLALSEEPKVSIGGFPFVMSVLRREASSVEVEARTFAVERITFEHVRLTLRDVRYLGGASFEQRPASFAAETGTGTVTLTAEAVTEALRKQGVPVTVSFTDETIHLSGDDFPGEVAAEASITGRLLVLEPETDIPFEVSFPLPPLWPGMEYRSLLIAESVATLEVECSRTRFVIPIEGEDS